MNLKLIITLSLLLSSFSIFSNERGGYGNGRRDGGYRDGDHRDGGHRDGDNGDAASILLSLYSFSSLVEISAANDNRYYGEQLVAIKTDAVDFLAGDLETESLKNTIINIRETHSDLTLENATDKDIALKIVSVIR